VRIAVSQPRRCARPLSARRAPLWVCASEVPPSSCQATACSPRTQEPPLCACRPFARRRREASVDITAMGPLDGDAADTAGAVDASTRGAPSPPERGAGRGAGASSVPSPAPPRCGAGLGTGGAAFLGPPLSGGRGAPPPPAPSAAQPSSSPSDVEEVDKDGNAATPPKKRRVWPVGTEGIRVDLLCASAVTMPGAHLAEWGRGKKDPRAGDGPIQPAAG